MIDLQKLISKLQPKDGDRTMGGTLKEKELPGGMIEVYRTCTITKKTYSVIVSAHKYSQYHFGTGYIQTIFPELDDNQREFLKTGTTPDEWNYFMGNGEEE